MPAAASRSWCADRFGRKPAFTVCTVIVAAGLPMITLLWSAIADRPALVLICMVLGVARFPHVPHWRLDFRP
ncbi:MAG: hypothetical protein U0587_19740 [Candidatus Binatia bacterium]